ncbi:protein kinase [Luteolibacter sp. Populi]|uniref:serine/threonine-protein kinase n=1 Tax=Luteolibacter sp. Populi TaxID=3230487 RepID=UPI0034669302
MPEGEPDIAYCHACGMTMDVSQVAPFSNVECPSCGKHTRVKREFGPYTLLRRHAIGGMSVVFIANDNTLGREVVVKILNEEYGADEKRIGAFEEEARITASFSHPHVVRVFTTGRAFGRFYIAMEVVGGGHMEHHIRERGSIPEGEMLPLAIHVADGLKAAHTAGLIHRDIKPGNILLDVSGNAKIVDFGLALVTKGGKAKAAEIWATPYYVPPETIEGLPEDFRSDIYAFGATLYHALAGKPPCDEESMDTNKLREAKRRILPLAKMAPWVSLDTCMVVDRAMAHEPHLRFRSYNDLLSALETSRQRLASGAAPVTPNSVARNAASKRRERMSLIGAGCLVLVAAAFGVWWVGRNREQAAAAVGPNSAPQSALSQAADPGAPDGARAGSSYREAGEALRSGDYTKARTLFAKVREDPHAMEPTGSWAACEAVVCAFLDGSSNEARKDARDAIAHLSSASGVDSKVSNELLVALDKVKDLRPEMRAEDAPLPTGPALMAALVLGLKNWEQGLPDMAKPHFEAVMAVEAKGADTWVEPYRKIITGYLTDAETLHSIAAEKLPDSPANCRSLADELHAVHSGLKTKGRARFNIRALQLDLEKRARLLEAAAPPAAPDPTPEPAGGDRLAQARSAAAECRFADAALLLKESQAGDESSAATLLLVEAADAFLGDLEEKLKSPPPADIALELRDATKLDRITGTRPGGLRVVDAAGEARDVPWALLSADSMIEIHRALVKNETSEIERLRRHEQAIAFDLLAGNVERGKKAGADLASRYPFFKRRWDTMQAGIP